MHIRNLLNSETMKKNASTLPVTSAMTCGVREDVELAGWKETRRSKTSEMKTLGNDQWVKTVQKDGVKKVRVGG
jgi:hypothetical protein